MTASPTHSASMAVWGVPDVVSVGETFSVKIGMKCSEGCDLGGSEVLVRDSGRNELARAALSAPGAFGGTGLCGAEVQLVAPDLAGSLTWEAVMGESEGARAESDCIHTCAPKRFGLSVSNPRSVDVNFAVIGQDSRSPLENVRIMLRPYRGYTDKFGCLSLVVAPGSYIVHATKDRYEDYSREVEVSSDLDVSIELEPSLYVEDYRGYMQRVIKPK